MAGLSISIYNSKKAPSQKATQTHTHTHPQMGGCPFPFTTTQHEENPHPSSSSWSQPQIRDCDSTWPPASLPGWFHPSPAVSRGNHPHRLADTKKANLDWRTSHDLMYGSPTLSGRTAPRILLEDADKAISNGLRCRNLALWCCCFLIARF